MLGEPGGVLMESLHSSDVKVRMQRRRLLLPDALRSQLHACCTWFSAISSFKLFFDSPTYRNPPRHGTVNMVGKPSGNSLALMAKFCGVAVCFEMSVDHSLKLLTSREVPLAERQIRMGLAATLLPDAPLAMSLRWAERQCNH